MSERRNNAISAHCKAERIIKRNSKKLYIRSDKKKYLILYERKIEQFPQSQNPTDHKIKEENVKGIVSSSVKTNIACHMRISYPLP